MSTVRSRDMGALMNLRISRIETPHDSYDYHQDYRETYDNLEVDVTKA